jgi:hypothetical protein
MRDRWGEIHLVVPDESAGKYDDREIIETYERTYSRIGLAALLWRLIGGEAQDLGHDREEVDRTIPRRTSSGIAKDMRSAERVQPQRGSTHAGGSGRFRCDPTKM